MATIFFVLKNYFYAYFLITAANNIMLTHKFATISFTDGQVKNVTTKKLFLDNPQRSLRSTSIACDLYVQVNTIPIGQFICQGCPVRWSIALRGLAADKLPDQVSWSASCP